MEHPSHDWFVQFVGLFLGEGCVNFNFRQRSDPRPRPQLLINLRIDDRPVLDEIAARLGGAVIEYDPATGHSSRQARWTLTGYKRVGPLVEQMCKDAVLPCRKVEQLVLMAHICKWRASWPNSLGPSGLAIVQEYVHQMRSLKLLTSG